MNTDNQYKDFFAIALQQHRHLGLIFNPYIIKQINKDGGIYTITETILDSNRKKWEEVVPVVGIEIIKILDEISDSTIHKQFSKGKTTIADFYKQFSTNEQLQVFVRSYTERRMLKCFEILCKSTIPVFLKEKNFNNLYDDHRLNLISEVASPVFHFVVMDIESRYHIDASCNGRSINLTTKNSEIVCNDPCLVRVNNDLFRFRGIDGKNLAHFSQNTI